MKPTNHSILSMDMVWSLSWNKELNSFIYTNFNLFPNDNISEWSKMKEFADDNLKFDLSGKKFSKWVENTVGKGEIARYEQFLLFPPNFKRRTLQTRKNQGLFGKGLTH